MLTVSLLRLCLWFCNCTGEWVYESWAVALSRPSSRLSLLSPFVSMMWMWVFYLHSHAFSSTTACVHCCYDNTSVCACTWLWGKKGCNALTYSLNSIMLYPCAFTLSDACECWYTYSTLPSKLLLSFVHVNIIVRIVVRSVLHCYISSSIVDLLSLLRLLLSSQVNTHRLVWMAIHDYHHVCVVTGCSQLRLN